MGDGGDKAVRAERLAAELRANLKKRKELARARARTGATDAGGAADGEDDSSAAREHEKDE